MTSQTQDAIVLTGTAANAAFEVGVMKGLLGKQWGEPSPKPPITPFCYSGTSSGALNAAILVSNAHLPAADALKRLEEIWLDRISATAGSATGLFRIRGDPSQYMQSKYGTVDPVRPWLDFAMDSLHVAKEFTQRMAMAASSSTTLIDGIVQLGEFSELLDFSPLRSLVAEVVDARQIAAKDTCKLRITAMDWQKGVPRTFENRDFK